MIKDHFNRTGERLLQLSAQMLHLRRQARLGQTLGVEQTLPKRRQARRLAALPHDQLVSHFLFPGAQLAPHVAVRQTNGARGGRDRALVAHRLQHVHHRVAQQGSAPGGQGRCAAPSVGEFHRFHGARVCPSLAYVYRFIPRNPVHERRCISLMLRRNEYLE